MELSSVDSNPVVTPSFFECEARDARNPEASSLKRLNKYEFQNTINDILARSLTAAETSTIMGQINTLIDAIPDEAVDDHNHLTISDHSFTPKHIDTFLSVVEKLAEIIMASNAYKNKIIGTCHTNAADDTCLTQFIQRFGKLSYRRPLKSEDVDWFKSVYQGHTAGYENLIAAFLSSPYFIYHYEMGEKVVAGTDNSVVSLSASEIANRLSYFYLQSLPDDELFSAAQNGSLLTAEGYAVQVNRLLESPVTRKRLNKYLSDQIFKIDETPTFRTDLASLSKRLSDLTSTATVTRRRENMIQEMYDFMDYIVWEKKGGYSDLMTSNLVFPRTADLAEIYDSPVWNGNFDESSLVKAEERSGVLTRALSLFTGTRSTRPIMRGVKVFNDYLCSGLPAPEDNDTPTSSVVQPHFTEREIVTAITQIPGTSCTGCHTGIINPLGFTFENFDSFGKFRTKEDVYFPDESINRGQVLATRDIASSTTINLGTTISGSFRNSLDLTKELSNNDLALACFNLKVWNFTSKQNYSIGKNDCATTSLFKEMKTTNSIYETLRQIPLQPEFLKRKIQ